MTWFLFAVQEMSRVSVLVKYPFSNNGRGLSIPNFMGKVWQIFFFISLNSFLLWFSIFLFFLLLLQPLLRYDFSHHHLIICEIFFFKLNNFISSRLHFDFYFIFISLVLGGRFSNLSTVRSAFSTLPLSALSRAHLGSVVFSR